MKLKAILFSMLGGLLLSQCAPEKSNTNVQASSKLLVIDAGHGGKDRGANLDGESEKHKTLLWAQNLREAAEKRGIAVILLREGDQYLSLKDRVSQTNALNADLLVSLHFGPVRESNWQLNYSEKGKQSKASQELAHTMAAAHPNHYKVQSGNFFVLNEVNCRALMVNASHDDADVLENFNKQILAAL